ncbi:MAG: hypothetical protein ATN35_11025 [Epulopiscium sp. Nele67-Bin004]|nr:MAG: hypothetical protein ATN35_11025 [Epulopiscium sp. Nele67-Bin004]
MIFNDIKRGLTEPMFYVALAIVFVVMAGCWAYYVITAEVYDNFEAFKTTQSLVLPFIAPLIVCIPYANMSMIEKETGYRQFILNKISFNKYVIVRLISNAIIGGLTLTLPLVVLCILCGVYSEWQIILLDFVFGASYATLAYGLTFFNDKSYIPTIVPQVIYLLLTYALPYMNLERFYPPLAYSPWLLPNFASMESAMLQNSVLILIGITLLAGGVIKEGLS